MVTEKNLFEHRTWYHVAQTHKPATKNVSIPFPVQNGSSSFQNGNSSFQNGNSSVENGKIIISMNINLQNIFYIYTYNNFSILNWTIPILKWTITILKWTIPILNWKRYSWHRTICTHSFKSRHTHPNIHFQNHSCIHTYIRTHILTQIHIHIYPPLRTSRIWHKVNF